VVVVDEGALYCRSPVLMGHFEYVPFSRHLFLTIMCSMTSSINTIKKGSPYSITKCRVPELILVLGSQPAGDMSHKPGSRLPLLSTRPAVTPATLKRAATNFAAW